MENSMPLLGKLPSAPTPTTGTATATSTTRAEMPMLSQVRPTRRARPSMSREQKNQALRAFKRRREINDATALVMNEIEKKITGIEQKITSIARARAHREALRRLAATDARRRMTRATTGRKLEVQPVTAPTLHQTTRPLTGARTSHRDQAGHRRGTTATPPPGDEPPGPPAGVGPSPARRQFLQRRATVLGFRAVMAGGMTPPIFSEGTAGMSAAEKLVVEDWLPPDAQAQLRASRGAI